MESSRFGGYFSFDGVGEGWYGLVVAKEGAMTSRYEIEKGLSSIRSVARKLEYMGMKHPSEDIFNACDYISEMAIEMDKKYTDFLDQSLADGERNMGLLLDVVTHLGHKV